MKIEKIVKKMEKEEIEKLVKNGNLSKSFKVIELFNSGMECKDIGILLGIRYNFAYNVIFNYCNVKGVKKEVSERNKNDGEVKKKIIEMYNKGNGKSKVEICKELMKNYNYVSKVCNESLNN